MPDKARRLAIIGTGVIGQALIRGLIAANVYSPQEIVATDIDKDRLAAFAREMGIDTAGNVEAVSGAGTILLSVSPLVIGDVLEEIAGYVGPDQVVISIAAGIRTQQVESHLRSGVPVIRGMPNTSCQVRAAVTAISPGKNASAGHVERAVAIFGAVGKVIEVPERLMDAVTGLSGSGPAYVYVAIQALSDAGVLVGLSRSQAALLAAQTVLGAAEMVIQTGKHPAELAEAVASAGGATIAGLAALERGAFRAALLDAVKAATERSREMSQE